MELAYPSLAACLRVASGPRSKLMMPIEVPPAQQRRAEGRCPERKRKRGFSGHPPDKPLSDPQSVPLPRLRVIPIAQQTVQRSDQKQWLIEHQVMPGERNFDDGIHTPH